MLGFMAVQSGPLYAGLAVNKNPKLIVFERNL